MSQRWLVVIVVASLALNLAVVAGFLFVRLREQRPPRPGPVPGLAREELEELRRLRREFAPRLDSLRERVFAARSTLMRLAAQPNPDARVVDSLLKELCDAETAMARLSFEHARRIVRELPPAARDAFFRRLEERPGHGFGRVRRMQRCMPPCPPPATAPYEEINP